MDVILAAALIIGVMWLAFNLYRRSVQAGGYEMHKFGDYIGERHWQKLNQEDDELD